MSYKIKRATLQIRSQPSMLYFDAACASVSVAEMPLAERIGVAMQTDPVIAINLSLKSESHY